MKHKRLIGAVASKGVGNHLRDQIGVGRARPLGSVGDVLGEFTIVLAVLFVIFSIFAFKLSLTTTTA